MHSGEFYDDVLYLIQTAPRGFPTFRIRGYCLLELLGGLVVVFIIY
jgi:hypothetical protein